MILPFPRRFRAEWATFRQTPLLLPPPTESPDPHFSEALVGFIQNCLPAIEAVEVLLFLHARPQRAWRADDVVREIHPAVIPKPVVVKYLELFQSRSLLAWDEAGYHYRPASADLGALVDALALAYKERPVSLVRLIYFLKGNKIQSFSDAFRIKKD